MSSTSFFGVLGEFDPSTDLFTAYLERLEQSFIANSIGQCVADASQELLEAADKKKSPYLFLLWARILMKYFAIYAAQINLKTKVFRNSVTS